jgi:hypothetical protein
MDCLMVELSAINLEENEALNTLERTPSSVVETLQGWLLEAGKKKITCTVTDT